jgi:adenylate kinase
MVDRYGYTHISSGDLLRAEVASGSERGQKLSEIMKKGALVPNKVVLNMIKEAMLEKVKDSNGFLIDGYPRKIEQGIEFEKEIVPCSMCLYIDASDKTMKDRLLNRGKTSGRSDDNEQTINERLKTFHKETKPVIGHYEKQGKLKVINSDQTSEKVFDNIKKLLDKEEGYEFDNGK